MSRVTKPAPRSFQLLLLAIVASLSTSVSAAPPPGKGKLSHELQSIDPGSTVDMIVQFRSTPADSELKNLAAHGVLKNTFRHFPAAVFRGRADALEALAANPNVAYISPDRTLTGSLQFAVPAVGADVAFSLGWTGTGIGIAIVDSGVKVDHPDIKGRVAYSENFVAGESTTDDLYGHGTHVAVAAAGNGYASTGNNYTVTFRGIAPRANVINLRVLDSRGHGTDSAVIAAIDRAIELKTMYNIRVLNLSLGRGIQESSSVDPLCAAVHRAWQAGITVVVAAGNNGRDNSMGTLGYGTISSPANSPDAITVGAMKDMGTATRADDLMASYSSKGPTLIDQTVKPDIVAPGNLIISGMLSTSNLFSMLPQNVVPVSYYRNVGTTNSSSVYFRLSGTSIAAPMVSGAVALLLQKAPDLTPDQIKGRLMKTAGKSFPATSTSTDPVTGAVYPVTYDLFTVGAGYLDIPAALSNNDLSTASARSPRALFNSADGTVSVITDAGSVWSDVIIWGTSVVWGNSVIVNGNVPIWGTGTSLDDSTSPGFVIIWGSSLPTLAADSFPQAVSAAGER